MTDIFKEINAINTIVSRAEREIYNVTGTRKRLIIAPDIDRASEPEPDPAGMLIVIANALGMDADAYAMETRRVEYVRLRTIGARMLKTYFPHLTLKNISELLGGNKDHTTIIHYLTTASNLLDSNNDVFTKAYQTALEAITQWLADLG